MKISKSRSDHDGAELSRSVPALQACDKSPCDPPFQRGTVASGAFVLKNFPSAERAASLQFNRFALQLSL